MGTCRKGAEAKMGTGRIHFAHLWGAELIAEGARHRGMPVRAMSDSATIPVSGGELRGSFPEITPHLEEGCELIETSMSVAGISHWRTYPLWLK